VLLLAQITVVTACAFAVLGLNETVIFAVIGQGLHRPPTFFGVYSSVQGAGAIAGGIIMSRLLRRMGSARMTGLAIAGVSLSSLACLTSSTAVVLAGAVADGIGLVWLVAVAGAAIQRYTPPRLQGRATAAWTMLVITPQTISIAAGAVLISYIDYRILLLAVIAVTGVCAFLLVLHPTPEPATDSPPGSASPAAAQEQPVPLT